MPSINEDCMRKPIAIALLQGCLGMAAWLALPALATPASGQQVDLTVHVKESMAGMASIPARTLNRKLCLQAGQFDPQAFVRAQSMSDCKITNYKKDGKTITFDEVCSAPQAVTSHGQFELTGGAGFTGTMTTAFSAGGHAVTVASEYTGKPDGTCMLPSAKAKS